MSIPVYGFVEPVPEVGLLESITILTFDSDFCVAQWHSSRPSNMFPPGSRPMSAVFAPRIPRNKTRPFSTSSPRPSISAVHAYTASNVSSQLHAQLPRANPRTPLIIPTRHLIPSLESSLQIAYTNPDSPLCSTSVLAVEVGFSQATETMCAKLRSLLEHTSVRVAVMLEVKEKPM